MRVNWADWPSTEIVIVASPTAIADALLRLETDPAFRAEQVAYIEHHILNAVAAQSAVEEQDEERGQDAKPAHPFELLAQSLVGAHSAVVGLAAQRQLAHHDDEAAQGRQDQVDDEECEAAVGAHLIGEAPDVAQADG